MENDIKLPRQLLYTYSRRGGWYPYHLGGWTRFKKNLACLLVYETEELAKQAAPSDCKVEGVLLTLISADRIH